ncbi:J domain-containing protein, partial [Streptomyces sparsus]
MTAPGPAHEQADHYAVLGVAPTASAAQITGAFRALVRALHPDVRPEHPPADERLARVVAAYDTLRDPERRAAYDAERRGATAP